MSTRPGGGRAAALWLGGGCALIVAVVVAGVLGSRAGDRSGEAPASTTRVSASTIPPTTIVYLTVPRTSAATTGPPPTTSPPATTRPPVATVAAPVPVPVTVADDGPRTFTFPSGSPSTSYDSTHHDYPAADMFTACGTPALAATDGIIEGVSTTDEWDSASDDPATRSGLFVALVDDRGVRYYSSHLASVGVTPGQAVAEGDQVGTVGDTGNAAGTGCHIHFGLSPACLTGWQNRRGLTYPQPFLDDWRSGGERDPLATVEAIGCG